MSKPNHTLSKTCMSCGLQKPLSAFLQFSRTQGAVYGNVCAACRKANQDKAGASKEREDTSKREIGGSRIRATERLAGEVDKKNQRDRLKNLYQQEQEKNSKEKLAEIQKVENTTASERKHRQSHTKVNRSFLDLNKAKSASERLNIFGNERPKTKEGEVTTQEISIADSFGKEKFKTAAFRQYRDWLGTNRNTESTNKSEATSSAPQQKNDLENKDAAAMEKSLTDYIKRTWGSKK